MRKYLLAVAAAFLAASLNAATGQEAGGSDITVKGKVVFDDDWVLPEVGSGLILFKAKATSDVKIAITPLFSAKKAAKLFPLNKRFDALSKELKSGEGYFVEIGAKNNTLTVIRDMKKDGPIVSSSDKANLLKGGDFESFWIIVDREKNSVTLGRGENPGDEDEILVRLVDDAFNKDVFAVGFGASKKNDVEFKDIYITQKPKVTLPGNFIPRGGRFDSVSAAGLKTFAVGVDGDLFELDLSSMENPWIKRTVMDINGNVVSDVTEISGFGSLLRISTKSGVAYTYHWMAAEAEKFLPTSNAEKKEMIKEQKKEEVKPVIKKGKPQVKVTGPRTIKKRKKLGTPSVEKKVSKKATKKPVKKASKKPSARKTRQPSKTTSRRSNRFE